MKSSLSRITFQKTLEKRNSFTKFCDCPICKQQFTLCQHTETQAREHLECELFEAQKKLFEDERLKK